MFIRGEILQFVPACFRHKRKTLRNNLAGIYGHAVDEWPEAGLRAEQIPLEGFVEMFERVVNWPRMNTDAHG